MSHDHHHEDDHETLEELGRVLGYEPTRTPSGDRVAEIRAAAERMKAEQDGPGTHVVPMRRGSGRRIFLAGGIAAGVGGIAGYVVRDVVADEPGTLSAEPGVPVEPITFVGDEAITSEAGLISHTWGVELLLEVTGLAAGTTYEVIYRTEGGLVPAGSMLAVDGVLMKCRFNAASLRAAVRAIAVRDPAGTEVLRADLPIAGV